MYTGRVCTMWVMWMVWVGVEPFSWAQVNKVQEAGSEILTALT